jgi:predicted RNA-binding Zn ribbon-like protein
MAVERVQDLPLAGGHLALDLVNTVEPRIAGEDQTDHLRNPADLLVWARRVDLIDESEAAEVAQAWARSPALAAADLEAAVTIRESLYDVLTGAAEGLPVLAAGWAGAGSRTGLVADGNGFRLVVGTSIPDRLSVAAVDLLTTADLTKLHACPPEQGGCGWLFLDHSRNSTRRWCVMEDCGAKAKSRRLTERRRADRTAVRDPDRQRPVE